MEIYIASCFGFVKFEVEKVKVLVFFLTFLKLLEGEDDESSTSQNYPPAEFFGSTSGLIAILKLIWMTL